MRSFLPAIALCAVLQPALADGPLPGHAPGTAPTATVMHASLTPVVAAQAGPRAGVGGSPVVVASIKPEAQADGVPLEHEQQHPTTVVMLATAFAIMTGIALRRWGADRS